MSSSFIKLIVGAAIIQLALEAPANFIWYFAIAAVVVIVFMLTKKHRNDTMSEQSTGKRKNDQSDDLSPDMLALLSDDDLGELRQRVKDRLIERIDGGGDGELSSLDALLAAQEHPSASAHTNKR